MGDDVAVDRQDVRRSVIFGGNFSKVLENLRNFGREILEIYKVFGKNYRILMIFQENTLKFPKILEIFKTKKQHWSGASLSRFQCPPVESRLLLLNFQNIFCPHEGGGVAVEAADERVGRFQSAVWLPPH